MTAVAQLGYSTLPREHRRRGKFFRVFKWLAVSLFWIGLACGLIYGATWAAVVNVGFLFGVFTPIALLLLLVSGAMLARGARRVRDLSILHYLEQAVRLNAPLAPMMAVARQGERGAVRSRLGKLRARLEAGDTLAMALAIASPSLPRRMIALVAGGEHTGHLAAALRRLTGGPDFYPAVNPTRAIFHRWYPMIMLVFCVLIAELMMYFVFSKFESFLRDFRIPVPVSLKWLVVISDDYGFGTICLGIFLSIFCGRMLASVFTPAGVTFGPLSNIVDRVKWRTPIVGGVIKNQAMADACFLIGKALEIGVSPAHAIAEATDVCPQIVLKQKLKRWSLGLSSGRTLADSAHAAKLPAAVGGLLAATPVESDLANAFDFLCRYYDGRFSSARAILRGAIIPFSAIVFGIVVVGFALGVFQPLLSMIAQFSARR